MTLSGLYNRFYEAQSLRMGDDFYGHHSCTLETIRLWSQRDYHLFQKEERLVCYRAKIYIMARDQGISAAVLWKLTNPLDN